MMVKEASTAPSRRPLQKASASSAACSTRTFATEDQKEGMAAFVAKAPARFENT